MVRDQRPRDPAYYCGLGRLPASPQPVTMDFWKQLADFRTARLGSQGPEHGAQWPFQPCLKSCSDQLSERPLHPREPPHACCRNQKPVARKEGSLQKKKKESVRSFHQLLKWVLTDILSLAYGPILSGTSAVFSVTPLMPEAITVMGTAADRSICSVPGTLSQDEPISWSQGAGR